MEALVSQLMALDVKLPHCVLSVFTLSDKAAALRKWLAGIDDRKLGSSSGKWAEVLRVIRESWEPGCMIVDDVCEFVAAKSKIRIAVLCPQGGQLRMVNQPCNPNVQLRSHELADIINKHAPGYQTGADHTKHLGLLVR